MIPGCAVLILACGVALATLTALTIGLLQVLEVVPSAQNWIPLAIYPFLALAILSPAVVGLLIALKLPRNRIAWILLLGVLPALQIASEQLVGAAWAYQTGGNRAASPVRLAARRRVRLPGRPALSRRWRWVAGMAIVSFAFTIGLKLFDPSRTRAERGHHEPSPRQRGRRVHHRHRHLDPVRHRGPCEPLCRRPRRHPPLPPIGRRRAPADEVARVGCR